MARKPIEEYSQAEIARIQEQFANFIMAEEEREATRVTEFIGARVPTTTLFLFGVIFLMLIALHYSVKISTLTAQVERLAQELAILKEQYDDHRTRRIKRSAEHEQGRNSSS